MTDNPLGTPGELSAENQRQLFYLGIGLYSAIFWINVVFYFAFDLSSPHIEVVRILAPVITVTFTIMDSIFLRTICRKQYPGNPQLLEKWPIFISEYPVWPYFVFIVMSCVISIYLVSRP
jgi:hypothetical protein